ncbi:hypothetical protein [Lentzea sp. NPDC003310]|uniref:hypothetical protein n=1 Tax=Lentzea sp. NPDC003310 TaxID=3154447 RepID=UPI0033ACDC86
MDEFRPPVTARNELSQTTSDAIDKVREGLTEPDAKYSVNLGKAKGVIVGDNARQWNTFWELPKSVRRLLIVLLTGVLVVGTGVVVVRWVVPAFAPVYKTTFLIDAAGGDLASVTGALTTIVGNSGERDSQSLRSFGGECGSEENTTQLVGFGTGNGREIAEAARSVRQTGEATLQRGIVEAVADFSTPLSLKAKQVNRIIVVTRHGEDACDPDAEFVQAQIRDRVAAAGLSLEFRFIGYQVGDERAELTRLATRLQQQAPAFTDSPEELRRVLEWFTTTEPVLRSSQSVVTVLNPTVDKLNSATKSVEDGRFDLAESALAQARAAVVDLQIEDLDGRTGRGAVAGHVGAAADVAGRGGRGRGEVARRGAVGREPGRAARRLHPCRGRVQRRGAADDRGAHVVARQGAGGRAMRRWLSVGAAVLVLLALVSGGLVLVLTPAHRTTFLVDSSESADFRDVADAVGTAAANMSPDDALALRRFGGTCETPDTAELVTPGAGQAARIGDAARAITPSGKPTLLSGVVAAIDDFARAYPLRGSETNRIVVVARGGADACGKSADEVRAIIREHTERAGVRVDFRFVGHRLTSEQAKVLKAIADATEAQATRFTDDTAELVITMKEVSVPTSLVAREVVLPKSPCELVTPEVLSAADPRPSEPQGVDSYYAGINCQQDRYVLATAVYGPPLDQEFPVIFELKDQKWQVKKVDAPGTFPCGDIPKDVWKAWDIRCTPAPVVCRDATDYTKVTDMNDVGCPVAIDIADRYIAAARAGQTQGTGTFWITDEWTCSKYPMPDRPNVANPLQCERNADRAVVRLGDNW